jgi:FtsZ-binding cell division protein ZapB
MLTCHYCGRSMGYERVERRLQEALAAIPLAAMDVATVRPRSDLVDRVQALTRKIEAVRQRRGALLNRRLDAEIAGDESFSEADYREAMAQSKAELERLEAERE